MKQFLYIIMLICSVIMLNAQNRKFTIVDVVLNSYYSLAPEKLEQINWISNSDDLLCVVGTNLIKIDGKSGDRENLLSLDAITDNSSKELSTPEIKCNGNNTISYWNEGKNIIVDLEENKIVNRFDLGETAENMKISNDLKKVAFTIDNNLFVSNSNGIIKQITKETNKDIVSGQSVSRNEFGITCGIFWSPKSNYVAFYQKDETEVTDYPLLEIGNMPATIKNTKYPMAGQTSETVRVGIYDIEHNTTVWLKTDGPKDQYLTNVTWGLNEEFIYVAHLNRDQDHLKLFKYDAKTGEQVKLLFEESDNEYVEPEFPLQFICSDKDKFIWFSERDGWNHLYLYNTDGELLKQITKGKWVVKEIIGVNEEKDIIYFTGTKDTPLETHLYKVDVKNGEVARLTELDSNHEVTYNKYNDTFLDTYSSLKTPTVTQIINCDGEILKELNRSKNPIDDYKISEPKIFSLKNKENIYLYSRIILPVEFDSTKKYPVIVYVYGGPHDQIVTNEWYYGKYDFWFQYMAQNGFIIFTLDNRGSSNRGLEFEQAIFGELGSMEIVDQLVGINYLKSLPYVDSERIGVFGWSYGGFMTTSLMLRTNDTYKVGVAGGTVIDWKMYEVMYGERYMDSPQKNPEGYKNSSLLNYVDNLNGKLLLVHGTSDPTVVIEHALSFVKKAANLNKPLDFYPYVGHGHAIKGIDAIHLYEKISNYFFDNL